VRSAPKVEDDGKDGKTVMNPQDGVVLEHPSGEVAPVLRLDFHVHENELWLSVSGLEPGDDVCLAHLTFGNVGEDFLSKKLQRLEVEPGRLFWEEELEEIPEQSLQDRFEELVVSHRFVTPFRMQNLPPRQRILSG
jgi:hypothetical protein